MIFSVFLWPDGNLQVVKVQLQCFRFNFKFKIFNLVSEFSLAHSEVTVTPYFSVMTLWSLRKFALLWEGAWPTLTTTALHIGYQTG